MIVARHETRNLGPRGPVNLLHFHQGQVLMISAAAVGLYRDAAALDDPLGNGAVGYEEIPEHLRGQWRPDNGFVTEQRAGFVGLQSGGVLFIRPDGIALYDDGASALRNLAPHWLIPFSSPA